MKKGVKITLIIISAIAVIAAGTLAATILFKSKIGGNINATAHGVVANDPSAAKKNTKALNSLIKNAEDGTVIELLTLEAYDAFLPGDNAVKGDEFITGVCVFNEDGAPVNEMYLSEPEKFTLLVAPDIANWHEMGPCEELTVSDNTFEGCSPKAIFICGAKSTKVENNNLGGSMTDVK